MDYQATAQKPRGAEWMAEAFVFYSEKIANVWKNITAPSVYGPEGCETTEQLRQYANSIRNTNPGFAADLMAAIDKSESRQ